MSEYVDMLPSALVPDQCIVLLRAGFRKNLLHWAASNCVQPCWVMWYNPDPGCSCIAGGKRYELNGEKILLIPPRTLYTGILGGTPRHYFLWFKTSSPFLTTRREAVELPAARFVKKMAAAIQPGPRRSVRLYALAEELLLSIPEEFFDNSALSSSAQLINRALNFINLRNGIADNGEIAEELHLSKTRLSHLFKAEMGISPQRYCFQIKMYWALQLLQDGCDIKSVAEACGFADRFHFSKEFKKCHGMPPGRWIRSHSAGSASH